MSADEVRDRHESTLLRGIYVGLVTQGFALIFGLVVAPILIYVQHQHRERVGFCVPDTPIRPISIQFIEGHDGVLSFSPDRGRALVHGHYSVSADACQLYVEVTFERFEELAAEGVTVVGRQ